MPIALAHLKRCDLFGLGEHDARTRLTAYLAEPRPPTGPVRFPGKPKAAEAPAAHAETIPFPGDRFARSNIGISVPRHFLGRDDEIEAIDAALSGDEGRVAIVALHGLRGVGKTTLAAAYAERHSKDYRAMWWIRAQTPDAMRADLVSLGVRLQWIAADEREEPALQKVRDRLRDEGQGLLLIYDNAVDPASLKPFLPIGGSARVLVTSNAHAWRGVAEEVEIEVWPKDIGGNFLMMRTGRDNERAAAEALSEALGGLPLAHEQAAAYCERLDVSLAEYRGRFEAKPARFLDDAEHTPIEHNYGMTVAKSFALGIDQASKLHRAAEPLITIAAHLAPGPIPLFLFSLEQVNLGPWVRLFLRLQRLLLGAAIPYMRQEDVEGAVAALHTYALIDYELIYDEHDPSIGTQTIGLHRLVREIAATRWLPAVARWLRRRGLTKMVAAAYPSRVRDDPSVWARARRLDALAIDLVGVETTFPSGTVRAAVFLLTALGQYRQAALAAYFEAQPLLERALAVSEKALGPDHPDTATSLNNLALLLWEQGHPESAQPLHERALTIREKALGPEHPATAESLNNLALDLHAQGDLVGARSLLERALEVRERALGQEHHVTAINLDNLAIVLLDQGDLSSARMLSDRAVAIFEKTLGSEHPDTNIALANQSRLCLARGVPADALSLAERALAAHEKLLGANHRLTRDSARDAANALDALGRAEEAAAVRARYRIGNASSG